MARTHLTVPPAYMRYRSMQILRAVLALPNVVIHKGGIIQLPGGIYQNSAKVIMDEIGHGMNMPDSGTITRIKELVQLVSSLNDGLLSEEFGAWLRNDV